MPDGDRLVGQRDAVAFEGGAGRLVVAGHSDVVVGHGANFGNRRGGQVTLELEDFESRGCTSPEARLTRGEGFGREEAGLPGGVDPLRRGLDLARGIVGFDQDTLLQSFELDNLPGRFEFGRLKVALPGIVRNGHAEDAADRPSQGAIFNILIDAFGKVVVDPVAPEAGHQVKLGQRGVAGKDDVDLTLL